MNPNYSMTSANQSKSNYLYIIGNGFDLHHGLKTRYLDFACYLAEKDYELFYMLDSYINRDYENDIWSDFENNLANFDIEELIADNKDLLPDINSEDFRDGDKYIFPDVMSDKLNLLTEGLIENFQNFILEVNIPKSGIERKVSIDKDAQFLTFNYTNTLEELYDIGESQIKYIHNSALNDDSIILGHGVDPDSFNQDEKPPEGLSDEESNRWIEMQLDEEFTPEGEGRKALQEFYLMSYKPTTDIIAENESYFESLSNIEEIHVLGHSLSEVDLPYFEKIIECVKKDAKWTVSYYSETEKAKHLATLESLGVKKENITMITLEDIQISNKQLKLDLSQGK